MNGYDFLLADDQTLHVPWWWFNALMVWMGVVGLVLWLFGRQLIKPMVALVGAGLLMLVVASGVRTFSDDMSLLWWLVGAAIVGAGFGWLLGRLVVAILFALLLGVLAPWVVIVVQDAPLPPLHEPIVAVWEELREEAAEAVGAESEAAPAADGNPAPDAPDADAAEPVEGVTVEVREDTRIDPEMLPSLREAWRETREAVMEVWNEWWAERSGGTRWAVLSSAGGAVVLGGALALVLPNLVGSLMTALLGVLLMIWPLSIGLAALPGATTGWVPTAGWPLAIVITLFVILGALIQFVIFRRPKPEEE